MRDTIKIIANTDMSIHDRGNNLIKDMSKLTENILDYRFACENYKGGTNSTVTDDMVNKIKNSLALLISDINIYTEQLHITNKVRDKADKRLNRIANRIQD